MNIKKRFFSEIHLNDPFFDSLKEDYPCFQTWFENKSKEIAYIYTEKRNILAFMYLKIEESPCPFITPPLSSSKKMKVGTFKVEKEKIGLGKCLLDIAINEAKKQHINELYVTVHHTKKHHQNLILFLKKHGFIFHGYKNNEVVYRKDVSNE